MQYIERLPCSRHTLQGCFQKHTLAALSRSRRSETKRRAHALQSRRGPEASKLHLPPMLLLDARQAADETSLRALAATAQQRLQRAGASVTDSVEHKYRKLPTQCEPSPQPRHLVTERDRQ